MQALEKSVEAGGALEQYEIEGPDRAELLQDLAEFQLAAVSILLPKQHSLFVALSGVEFVESFGSFLECLPSNLRGALSQQKHCVPLERWTCETHVCIGGRMYWTSSMLRLPQKRLWGLFVMAAPWDAKLVRGANTGCKLSLGRKAICSWIRGLARQLVDSKQSCVLCWDSPGFTCVGNT